MGSIYAQKLFPNIIELLFLENCLYAKNEYIWGKPRSRGWSVDLIFQDHLSTHFLELGGPDFNRNRVILIETDLLILNDPSKAINIMRRDIVIAIRGLSCLAHVLQLRIDHH